MIVEKMLILWSLLALLGVGKAEEIRTSDYAVIIERGVLSSVEKLSETEKLDLSNRGIKGIKYGVFKDVAVKTLNLKSNEILILEYHAFSDLGEHLEELNLGSNQIGRINSSFVGLNHLKLLNISDNPLAHLAAGDLAGIPKTAEIIVKGNKMRYISRWIFEMDKVDERDDDDDDDEYNRDDDDDEDDNDDDDKYNHRDTAVGDRVIVCIEDSILKKVASLEKAETLPENCVDNTTSHGFSVCHNRVMHLKLKNLDIQGVAEGWFQLEPTLSTYIDLSHNNLTELSPELLNDLPKTVKSVDLSHNLIRRIENDTVGNVHLLKITLKANLIEEVEDGSFESSDLSELDFTDNLMSDIGFAASLPSSLKILKLSKNQISNIEDGLFSRLGDLVRLKLAHNQITKIQVDAFRGLTSLKKLDLSHNEISKIEAGGFSGPKELRHIILDHNSISSCDEGVFDQLGELRELHLRKNNFTEITRNNFARLPGTLRFLDLNGNEITDIESGFFVDVPNDALDLSNNKLSKILPNQFKIDHLTELELENNSISELSPDSFLGLPRVDYLSLAGNQITEIPRGIARNFKYPVDFEISRNPVTKLQDGAFYGVSKSHLSKVWINGNKLEVIQGGIFEDV